MNLVLLTKPKRCFLYIIGLIILSASSCTSYKKLLYFQGDETQVTAPENINTYKLRSGDILSIVFFTPDPKSAAMFNMDNEETSIGQNAYNTGYSIDDSGYVDVPVAGKIQAKGLMVYQVDSLVSLKLKEFFNFYTVDVKLSSFTFVAVGEFNSKGLKYVYNDKCTIFEAIGIAGDMTDYANKTKIKLIRKTDDGIEHVYKLNLTDYSVYSSPAYNVQPHDIIYVQPQKAKVDAKNIQYVSLTLGLITLTLTLLRSFK